jgi:hypothetical protein
VLSLFHDGFCHPTLTTGRKQCNKVLSLFGDDFFGDDVSELISDTWNAVGIHDVAGVEAHHMRL